MTVQVVPNRNGEGLPIVFPDMGANPISISGSGQLYGKAVGGRTEFFYEDSSGSVVQITNAGLVNNGGTGTTDTNAWHHGGDTIGSDQAIGSLDAHKVKIMVGGTSFWVFDTAGNQTPTNAGAQNIGSFADPIGELAGTDVALLVLPGDANAAIHLSTAGLAMGAGGSHALDWFLNYTSTGIATLPAASYIRGNTPVNTADLTTKGYADALIPVTTKGDLFVYSTTSTRLPVGTNNWALFAESAQTTGLQWAQIDETKISLSDVTTLNVSSSQHGFTPKLPADATKFLNGTGSWVVPSVIAGNLTINGNLTVTGASTDDSTISGSGVTTDSTSTVVLLDYDLGSVDLAAGFDLAIQATLGDFTKTQRVHCDIGVVTNGSVYTINAQRFTPVDSSVGHIASTFAAVIVGTHLHVTVVGDRVATINYVLGGDVTLQT